MKITTEMTHAAYQAAKNVYYKNLEKKSAIEQLKTNLGMNKGSASDYIENFRCMIQGLQYSRTSNAEATDYFFSQILSDFGAVKLEFAIKAANAHVRYYEGLGKSKLNKIRSIISKHQKILQALTLNDYPDEIENPEVLIEGSKKSVVVNSYERNPKARLRCIEHYGVECDVCNFNFEESYGDIGKGFIHVHHLTSLSTIKQGYEVDPVKDLRPVCPNCHAMLHKNQPAFTIEELKSRIQGSGRNQSRN